MLGDVFDRDQAFQFERVIHHQEAFEFVFVQQRLGLLGGRTFGHRDQAFTWRHDVFDLHVIAGFKAQIAATDDADHFAAVADRETGNAHLIRHGHDLTHRVLGGDDDRVEQHAALIAFDLGHLSGLLLRREVFVDDAHAAFLGDGDGQTGFGDRVHGGRHQGQVQGDAARELGGKLGVLGQDF